MPCPVGTTLRTLPLRVAPLPGEAIDSWLEALAARHRATFGAVLAQCDLHASDVSGLGLLAPPSSTVDDIAFVTGVASDVVQDLTLPLGDVRGRGHRYRHCWGWRTSSRYCPHCLTETGGRWKLSWRHNTTFACTAHHCLLVDSCPGCHQALRVRSPRMDVVPVSGCCANSSQYRRPEATARCGADLTAATSAPLGSDHRILHAQQRLDALRTILSDIRAVDSCTARDTPALSDITELARWMVSAVHPVQLGDILLSVGGTPPADLPNELATFNVPHAAVDPGVATIAVGYTLALAVLEETPGEARNLLQDIMSTAIPGRLTRSGAGVMHARLSARADVVYAAAFERAYNDRRVQFRLAASAARNSAALKISGTGWRR